MPKADGSGIASMLPSEAYCFVTWMGEEAVASIERAVRQLPGFYLVAALRMNEAFRCRVLNALAASLPRARHRVTRNHPLFSCT